MDGVIGVRFLKQKKGDLHQVVVLTDGAIEITFEQVVEALNNLDHYTLKTWTRESEQG